MSFCCFSDNNVGGRGRQLNCAKLSFITLYKMIVLDLNTSNIVVKISIILELQFLYYTNDM